MITLSSLWLSSLWQEVANLKKQLGSAQRVEEDLRKQHASAASAVQKEEKQKQDALARLKGSIELEHLDEVKKLREDHEHEMDAKNRELAASTIQVQPARVHLQPSPPSCPDPSPLFVYWIPLPHLSTGSTRALRCPRDVIIISPLMIADDC